ncbi:EutN/CcmL family microcompartment protein [Clostridium sp. CCUG 7971]|uniref:EutN/CcmL family microcompartment protein n=1 Tax=Clostridium sp. CCUG 7971 TaxID=2811414 RepID=UPI001ABBC6EF|nr:EutN/CcmL family microcompartment protein [Clostridium sp. CCUG 7971]MBO3443802.1 EutN/CcmL family microcompartment protein [Clostridium sp. CCUG 7971]
MILAKVIGRVISNQKTPDLMGAKLLLVSKIDEFQNLKEGITYVAVDKVGAGQGDIVLVGDSATNERKDSYQEPYQDMSIVAIVENIQLDN